MSQYELKATDSVEIIANSFLKGSEIQAVVKKFKILASQRDVEDLYTEFALGQETGTLIRIEVSPEQYNRYTEARKNSERITLEPQ